MTEFLFLCKIITIVVGIFLFDGVIYLFIKKRKHIGALLVGSKDLSKIHGTIFGYSKSLFGRKYLYSPESAEGSTAVFGAPGTGKTSCLLIPSLRSLTGTAFVIDISGDISRNVPDPRKIEYSPGSPNTPKYNVFASVDSKASISNKNEELTRLAHLIMPEQKDASSNARYFQDGGRDILKAALLTYYYEGMDFPDICRKIVSSGYQTLFSDIDNIGNPDALPYINKFEKSNETNISGCKENCDSAIMLFATNVDVTESLGRNGNRVFSPETLENQSIYIIIPDNKLKLYAPLLRIITAQHLDFFSARPRDKKSNIIFALDEFATLSLSADDIIHALRTLRKRKVKLWMFCQSLIDLDVMYGREMRLAMMDNFAFTVVLSARNTETQRYFCELIGKEAYEKESYSGASLLNKGTKNISIEQRYIIEPTGLANLGDELILLHPGGYTKLHKNPYYGTK